MWYYIVEVIFILSVGVIAYLVVKKLPYIERIEKDRGARGVLSKRSANIVHTLDKRSLSFLGRFLRKLRVFVLRVDNSIAKNLESVKKKTEEQNAPNLLKEIVPDSIDQTETPDK